MKFRAFFIPLAAAVMMSSPTLAEEPPLNGQISAVSFHALGKKSAVVVKLYDDSEASVALKSSFEAALKAQGYQVVDNARYALSFDIENNVSGTPTADPGRLQLTGQSGGYSGPEEYTARMELYSSERADRGSAHAAGFMRMDVSITDRSNGRRVWQGWADSNSTGQNPEDVSARLVYPLVQSIGETIRNQPLSTPR